MAFKETLETPQNSTCSVPGCSKPHHAKTYCQTHYMRQYERNTTSLTRVRGVCSLEGCESPHKARGYCLRHYQNLRRHGDPLYERQKSDRRCEVPDCEYRHRALGLCSRHYWKRRWKLRKNLPRSIEGQNVPVSN